MLLRPSDSSAAETPDSSAAETPDSSAAETPDSSAAETPDSSAAETPDSSAAETPTSQWRVLLGPLRAADTQPPVRLCVMCVSAAEIPVATIYKAPFTGEISRRFLDRHVHRSRDHTQLLVIWSFGANAQAHILV